MAIPIVTLSTDFGLSDHYAGTMKGVILGICPQACIVDITHEVKPFAIAEGAYAIAQAYRFFPRKTVHIVVVDPGVGTARRPILAEAAGQYFVAPDNGVLGMIFAREKHKVRVLSNEKLFLHPVSRTFHGRDIFAPAGAHLAAGSPPSEAGKLIADYVRPPFEAPQQVACDEWTGCVLKVDRFGNVVTNFYAADFPDLERRGFDLSAGLARVTKLAHTYAECSPGELFGIVGSSGYLEISAALASAAAMLGRTDGTVRLTFR